MEEEVREQPSTEQATALNAAENCADSGEGSLEVSGTETEFGKFKDAKALLDAYNSLEAEFTKKCQRLAALEQDKMEQTTGAQRDLQSELDSFLATNSDAIDYKDQLVEIVNTQTDLLKTEKPFENAWNKLISSHVSALKTNGQVDSLIGKYVLSNGQIEKSVVTNYLKKLSQNVSPVVFSASIGERVSSVSPGTPTSMQDAKQILTDMFR